MKIQKIISQKVKKSKYQFYFGRNGNDLDNFIVFFKELIIATQETVLKHGKLTR